MINIDWEDSSIYLVLDIEYSTYSNAVINLRKSLLYYRVCLQAVCDILRYLYLKEQYYGLALPVVDINVYNVYVITMLSMFIK